jgi:hypothetical protein
MTAFEVSDSIQPVSPSASVNPPVATRSRALQVAIEIVLLAAVVVEGIVIATLLVRQPREPAPSRSAAPFHDVDVPPRRMGHAAAVTPVFVAGNVSSTPRASVDQSGTPRADVATELARWNLHATAASIAQVARNHRYGGVRLSAPIELKVVRGDHVLGSSAEGPIVTTAGTHDLELINSTLGFRTRRAVTFRAGEITTVAIPVPSGRISVNAAPWAEVWIDGRKAGETPLANLEIPIGEHELVFRHPDLGERRQRVVVRADTVARVSTRFDR